MYYPESYEKALEFADAAHAQMRELSIPATPTNYTIWYVYHSGAAPDLRSELDRMLEDKREFTTDGANQLYERHFGMAAESDALKETGERLEAAVSKLMGYLGEAGADAASYGEALETMSGQLSQPLGAGEVRTVISAILEETKRIATQHEKLQATLSESSKEIDDLRQSIFSVRQEALTDALTGIANRKAFDERLRAELNTASDENEPLSLLMLDIDHFKRFNDTYGHLFGDQVLRLVARTFTECIKGRDMAARYGGEEFAIVLPRTEHENALVVAEQIRASVAAKQIVNRRNGEKLGQITISIGASTLGPGQAPEDFIKRADRALYAAKRGGRNQVISDADLEAIEAA